MEDKLLETVKKSKRGDSQARADLYNLTERMVYFTALKILRDEDMAQDIVQDTYIKVFSEISKIRDNRAIISWIKSIVINLCKNHIKKQRPSLFASDEDEMRALADIPEISEDFLPEEYAEKREKSRLVMEIVDALPEKQRMTVILFYFDGLSVHEVAQIMETSEGTVKSRLNYARKQIRDEVEKLDKEGTKLYAIPMFLLSKILRNASLDYSLPPGVSKAILTESLKIASGSADASGWLSSSDSAGGNRAGTDGSAVVGGARGSDLSAVGTGENAIGGGISGRSGGFAGQNSGNIVDCYSISELNTRKVVSGGFAGENSGSISHSFYSGPLRRIHGGVSGVGKGESDNSYYFHNENDKKLSRLRDKELAKSSDAVRTQEAADTLGFDTKNIWEPHGGHQALRFIRQKWLYKTDLNPEVIVIHSAEELIELSRKINEGDSGLASATIRLERDIDLGGIEWTPIGCELIRAFTGLFDGCGHMVKNFVIKSKGASAKGFFGYLKGEVYNLTVDCLINDKTGANAGGVAAVCDGGVIGCCAAIALIKCRGGGNYGGLVGVNTGTIFQSYSAGKISSALIPWLWTLPLLPLLLLCIMLLKPGYPDSLTVFAPVPEDANIRPIPGAAAPVSGGNFVSFQFDNEVDVNLTSGECVLNFNNPGTSNHDVVVQMQFTDAQAARVMGGTGRTAEEQQKLDANPRYDPENYRVVIAESGAIPPGYQLTSLQLTDQPSGASLPPGTYSATIYLIFYEITSHNRAMLESQLPVTINVHY